MNKRKLVFWLVLAVLLTASAYALIVRPKFSADSVSGAGLDVSTLANLEASQTTFPIIQLSYTKEQIKKALDDYKNHPSVDLSNLDALSQKIINELEEKKTALALQSSSEEISYKIIDKDGVPVDLSTINTGSIIAETKDNFDFDTDITEEMKNIYISAYPKIEAIYGKRSNNNKIKIEIDENQGAWSYFYPELNKISLGKGISATSTSGKQIMTHELVHAFRGVYCLPAIWEEGSANFISNLILNTGGMVTAPHFEANNTPFGNFETENATTAFTGAYISGWIFVSKLYQEDKSFFKRFNSLLYQTAAKNPDIIYSQSQIINLATKTLPIIEGEPSTTWFNHFYYITKPSVPIANDYNTNPSVDKEGKFDLLIFKNLKKNKANTYHMVAKDYSGKVIADCQANDSVVNSWNAGIGQACANRTSIKGYTGLVQVTLTFDGNESDARTKYYPIIDGKSASDPSLSNINTTAVIISSNKADDAVIANKDNPGWKITVPVTNGIIQISDAEAKKSGRYEITLRRNITKICYPAFMKKDCTFIATNLYKRTFNRDAFLIQTGIQITMKSGGILGRMKTTLAKNRSIDFTTNASQYVGQLLTINGTIVDRYWGPSNTFTVNNLNKNTTYKYSMSFVNNGLMPNIMAGTVRTGNAADLTVKSVSNSGDPAQNTFARQYELNAAYNKSSLSSIKLFMVADNAFSSPVEIPIKLSYPSTKSFKIVPDYIYFNTSYTIKGLDKIEDSVGNPIYITNETNGLFGLDRSSKSGEAPKYEINKLTDSSSKISFNFTSADLATKIRDNQIKIDKKAEERCEQGEESTCTKVNASFTLNSNTITINILDKPAPASYSVTIPELFDDNKNRVLSTVLPVQSETNSFDVLDFNCDGFINDADATLIGNIWMNKIPLTPITNEIVVQQTGICKPLGDYLGGLLNAGKTAIPLSDVSSISNEIKRRSIPVI